MQINDIINGNNRRWKWIQPVLPVLLLFIAQFSYADGHRLRKDSAAEARNNSNKTTVVYTPAVKAGAYADLSFEQLRAEFMPEGSVQGTRDSAKNLLDEVAKANAWIDAIGENATVKVPFGIKKKKGGTEYQVGFSNVEFGANGGVARVFARIILPQRDANGEKKQVFFAGTVALSRVGGVITDGKLPMVGDEPIKTSDQWSIVLNGDEPSKNRKIEDQTYFKFDCNGFKELGLNGEVVLSKDYYIPTNNAYEPFADPSARITAAIKSTVTSWDDMMIPKLKFSRPFAVKTVKDYRFEITEATLDFSDEKNPVGTTGPGGLDDFKDYLDKVQPDEQDTWRGLYVSAIKVALPNEFRPKGVKDRITLETTYAVLDATGFSTVVSQLNVLTMDKGVAGSWPFSVDKLSVIIRANKVFGGGMEGQIVLPIQDKSKVKKGSPESIAFSGKLLEDGDWEITAGFGNNVTAPLWKANLELDKSSVISIAVINGVFKPSANLSGKLTFNSDGGKDEAVAEKGAEKKSKKMFSCEGVRFEQLVLQTEKPYLSVKALGVDGTLNIASFEAAYSISASTIKPKQYQSLKEDMLTLNFAADVKLMAGKIGGKTDFSVYSIYNEDEGQWKYYDYKIGTIAVKADFGKASFAGELNLLRNDPTFGNGFAGSLSMKVNKFEVSASGIFGTQTNPKTNALFRYWSVDGLAKGIKITTGPIVFTGFSGGISYKMALSTKENVKMPSGILYVPDDNAFLRVRAGTMFDVASDKAMTATAGLEMVFNNNWGINEVIISGTAKVMSSGGKGDADAGLKAGLKSTASDTKPAAPKETSAVWGNIRISLDLANDIYQGKMEAFANFNEIAVGGLGGYKAGTATFYISPNKWNINIGTQAVPVMFNINQAPVYATGTGYFMMGNDIQAGGSAGFGVKHGLSFSTEVGYDGGWLYARVGGGLKYDIMLFKKENFYCNGAIAGLNGWYGSARMSAWLYANVGVRFWSKEFNVLSASIFADLEIRGPRPIYFFGNVNGRYKVGWGWFSKSGSFNVEVKKGTYCPF